MLVSRWFIGVPEHTVRRACLPAARNRFAKKPGRGAAGLCRSGGMPFRPFSQAAFAMSTACSKLAPAARRPLERERAHEPQGEWRKYGLA